ncbi:MAG: TlpA family protein disulfide reductase [Saprospiraceae bacterium]|nr:TlpA family protein disulfide reductase [Saprospiraceae bacterium]
MATKLTLVDLWASWCAPCRKENKQVLVPLWDQFHKKGFEIIGYALDSSEKGWKAAILNDGADRWKHFSHLKGDESPVFETIHMTMIPANFLLDSRGVIVAKNLHGESLKKFVEDYFRS